MDSTYKPLEAMEMGDHVRFRQTRWYVKRKDLYGVSAQYKETQWTLVDTKNDTRYLVRAMEKQERGWEEFWIWTREISLAKVEFQTSAGVWKAFRKTLDASGKWRPIDGALSSSAPRLVRYRGLEYSLHAENTGMARDDEGNVVPKTTWDYLDAGQRRNLALEIWREPDQDYPEAYDGESVDPAEFELLPAPLLRRVTPEPRMRMIALVLFVLPFFLISAGMPFDQILAAGVPILLITLLMAYYTPLAWGMALLVGAVCAAALFLSGTTSFRLSALVCLLASVFIPPLFLRMQKDAGSEKPAFVSWAGVLPVVWSFSFYIYFTCAPVPHEGYQLMAACSIPLIIFGVCYACVKVVEVSWLNRN